MLPGLLRRALIILLLLVCIFFAAKGLIRALPGDPVDAILAETGTNLDPAILRHDLGLDRGFWEATSAQLLDLVFRFEWGTSIAQKRPIGAILTERIGNSISLALVSLVSALLFSFSLAFFANLKNEGTQNRRNFLHALSAFLTALPTAWIGPILALLLAVRSQVFSLSGGIGLPALTLALALSGFWLRAFSDTLERELRSDVVRTARAKGLGMFRIAWKHALLPVSGPLLAYLGSQTGALFAGAVITETIFDRPGLGSLLIESIFKRDYPLIESVLLVSSALILSGNLVGDLLQTLVQPRLREEERSS